MMADDDSVLQDVQNRHLRSSVSSMTTFMTDLIDSIFTPGPSPTLLVATHATFASLQVLLAILLVATRSVHFIVLSILSAVLWWAVHWFASELATAKAIKEREDERLTASGRGPTDGDRSGEDTETESHHHLSSSRLQDQQAASQLTPGRGGEVRHRRSKGDLAGDVSTEDEWEKVSEGADKG